MWTLPNTLTFIRVLAAPGVALVFVLLERPMAERVAVALFVGAALTDYLDGFLARRWRQESGIGKMLDPIADKAMVTITLGVLLALYGLPWWLVIPVAVILLREVLVSGLREYLGDVKLPVTPLAKWKTTVQMVAITLLLLEPPMVSAWHLGQYLAAVAAETGAPPVTVDGDAGACLFPVAGGLALWLAAGLTAMTGWDYFSRGVALIRKREEA